MDSGSSTSSSVPASPKKLAYLSYMGATLRSPLSEIEADMALNRLESVSDYEQWRQLVEKKNEWHTDRFLLHPQLFAAEFEVYYHSELPEILSNYVRSQAPAAAELLTPSNIRITMESLSSENPSWWRSPRRQSLFLAELLEKRSTLLQSPSPLASLRDGLHHFMASMAAHLRSWWSKGSGGPREV